MTVASKPCRLQQFPKQLQNRACPPRLDGMHLHSPSGCHRPPTCTCRALRRTPTHRNAIDHAPPACPRLSFFAPIAWAEFSTPSMGLVANVKPASSSRSSTSRSSMRTKVEPSRVPDYIWWGSSGRHTRLVPQIPECSAIAAHERLVHVSIPFYVVESGVGPQTHNQFSPYPDERLAAFLPAYFRNV